jgi:hypothetical protein
MSEFDNDIVCVKGRVRDGSPMHFYRRSNGIKLTDYRFIRSVKSNAKYGYDFDEYVHKDDYDAYVEAYKNQGDK